MIGKAGIAHKRDAHHDGFAASGSSQETLMMDYHEAKTIAG